MYPLNVHCMHAYSLPKQVRDAPDEAALRSTVMSATDLVLEAGFSKPIQRLSLVDRDEIINLVSLHHCILKSKAELDDLKNGLGALGVSDIIASYPDLLRPFFTSSGILPITAGTVCCSNNYAGNIM